MSEYVTFISKLLSFGRFHKEEEKKKKHLVILYVKKQNKSLTENKHVKVYSVLSVKGLSL